MVTDRLKVSDIDTEMKEIADKYIKAVLINAKRSYYRVLRRIEREGMSAYDRTICKSNLFIEEKGFSEIDMECFCVDCELFAIEKSELTDALLSLTRLQLEILLKSVLTDKSQAEIAAQYGITTRMVRKHKLIALEKLRRRLLDEK